MAEKLFGTDGYRGAVDFSAETGINPHTFEQLAFASTQLASEQQNEPPVVIVGSDTRVSSPALRDAACTGAQRAGAEVWDLGVAPTPVIAWLAKQNGANAMAITASHNPGEDNGLKLFDSGGVKPSRQTLDEIEKRYRARWGQELSGPHYGQLRERPELLDVYLEYLVTTMGGGEVLEGKTVIVDGANGAAHELAPRLYRALGAEVMEFACQNDGLFINDNCGAAELGGVTDLMRVRPELVSSDGFLGAFASDGDADRVMGVDRFGRKIDGNHWMRRLAIGQTGIVGTIYTNTALRQAVADMGVEFHECDNGDSYVTAMLQELTAQRGAGFTRGGEFTGHLIDLDHLSSGDGLYMGAWLATQLAHEGKTLADLYDEISLWPEKMTAVQLAEGVDAEALLDIASVQEAIQAEKEHLGSGGRIIVRPSGTEPVVRVWAEAKNGEVLDRISGRISQALQAA